VWALLALLAGCVLGSKPDPADRPSLSSVAGRHVIHGVTPEAAAAGLAPRDRLLAVDGMPTSVWLRDASERFRPGAPNLYRVRKPDGRQLEVSLEPLAPGARSFALETLVSYGVLAVGLVYLGIGPGSGGSSGIAELGAAAVLRQHGAVASGRPRSSPVPR
jgi:hypothetical protein